MTRDPHDPKGLIRESFAIDAITASECRSIFLDWALSLPLGAEVGPHVRALLDRYGPLSPDHPMIATLQAALQPAGPATRRGGRAGRARR